MEHSIHHKVVTSHNRLVSSAFVYNRHRDTYISVCQEAPLGHLMKNLAKTEPNRCSSAEKRRSRRQGSGLNHGGEGSQMSPILVQLFRRNEYLSYYFHSVYNGHFPPMAPVAIATRASESFAAVRVVTQLPRTQRPW
jgi:hypothetical protein